MNKRIKFHSKRIVIALRKIMGGILIFNMAFTGISSPKSFAGDNCIVRESKGHISYVKDEIIVKFKPKLKDLQVSSLQAQMSLIKKERVPIVGADVMKIRNGRSVESVISELNANGMVEYVQPNYIYYPTIAMPTDEYWNQQWGLNNTGQVLYDTPGTEGTPDVDIDAPETWEYTLGMPEVTVAVIDTGVDINHTDLTNNIWINPGEIPDDGIDNDGNGYVDDVNGWDFLNNDKTLYDIADLDEHGTHVAGVIAAEGNTMGIIGVAPKAKIMPLKFIGLDGGTTADAIAAINYAAQNGAKIINASWGSPLGSDDDALNTAIVNSGLLFVASAGNGGEDEIGDNNDNTPQSPANLTAGNIMSVAAVDNKGELADFSNYGALTVDIAAPGVNILSTLPGNSYGFGDGTSMAAPYVSGVAAVLMAQKNLTPQETINLVKNSGVSLPSLTGKTISGKMLNMYNAVATPVWPENSTITASDLNENGVTLNWTTIIDNSNTVSYSVYCNNEYINSVSSAVYSITGLSPGNSYTFKIEARYAFGNLITNGPSLTIWTDVSPPAWADGSALTVSNITQDGLSLQWTPALDGVGVDKYKVYKGNTLIQTVNGDVYNCDISDLQDGTNYTFKVEAGDIMGNWSTDGPSVSVTTEETAPAGGGGGGGGIVAEILATDILPQIEESISVEEIKNEGDTILRSASTVKADDKGIVKLTSEEVGSIIARIEKLAQQKSVTQSVDAQTIKSNLVINVESTEAAQLSLNIPYEIIESAGKNGIDIVSISSTLASINIPSKTFNNIKADSVDMKVGVIPDRDLTPEQRIIAGSNIVYDFSIFEINENKSTKINSFASDIGVDIPYTLKEDENPDAITVYYLMDNGQIVNMQGSYNSAVKTVSFQTNHFSKYIIKSNDAKFNDIENYSWAKTQIKSMAAKGIIGGKKEGYYNPGDNITRAEFVALLVRMLRINNVDSDSNMQIKDLKAGSWYIGVIEAAVREGLITGYKDGTIRPNDNISRQDMAVMLSRVLKKYKNVSVPGDINNYLEFKDKESIAQYAREGVAILSEYAIVKGDKNNAFNPGNYLTRAEAAVAIYNIFFFVT